MALTNLAQITTSGIATGTDLNIRNITGVAATFTGNVTVGGTLTYEDVTNIDSVGLITARSGINVNSGDVNITSGNLALASATPMVVASNGSGHLRLGAGGSEKVRISSTGLVGINSTTPRSKLHVANGSSSFNPGNPTGLGAGAVASLESNTDVALQFLSSNTTDNFIYFGDTDSATTGSIQYDHSTNAMSFNVNGGTERLRITSGGFIGISNISPELQSSAARNLVIGTPGSGGQNGLTICSNTSGTNNIYFGDASSGQGESMGRIVYSHADDSLRLHTVVEERLRITSTGNVGIGTVNVVAKVDVVTGTGDGTQNEANCLRLRNRANNGNAMTLQVGVNTAAAGALNQGYAYLQGRFWGGGNNPILLNPKGGNVGIGRTSAHVPLDVNGDTILRTAGQTTQGDLTRKYGFTGPNNSSNPHAYIAGVADQTLWYQGLGLVFGTVRGNDIGGTLGVERMRISSDGNIGIGTDNPGQKLTVRGTTSLMATNSTNQWMAYTYTDNTFRLNYNGAGADEITVLSSGEVGVGAFTPGAGDGILQISGGLRVAGSASASDTTSPYIYRTSGSDHLNFATSGVERLRITSAGDVGIGTDTPYANNSFNSLSIGGSGKYGLIELNKSDGVAGSWIDVYGNNGNGDLRITTAGTSGAITFWTGGSFTEKVRIASNGAVGIGTNSPDDKLHVLGGNIQVGKSEETGYETIIGNNVLRFNRTAASYIDQAGTGDIRFRYGASNNTWMHMEGANGRIGIGIDNPTSDLHVFRSTAASSIIDAAAGDALLTLRNAGNTNWSGINFTRERNTGTNVTGGSIWMPSDTSNNSATLYLQTQSASANAGADGALTDNNGVRLKLASQPGGSGPNSAFTVEVGSTERLRITSGGNVKINNPSMVGGTNAANALLQIKATGQYDGLVFGNTYSQGAIGTNSQGALIYTGNAAPANLGGGLKHTHIWYSGSSGGGGPSEKMSLSTDGTLYLGPYDAPGSYTTAANNVPYSIKVAPYGWQHHSEIAAISMGNHSGSTGNDDGEIVFKTAKDAHSSTTGLVERLRIKSDGDAIFYGNPSIDATDLYYTNQYTTGGWSTSSWYTVVPHGLTSNSTYLVVLVWDFNGSGGSPYYVATQQLYSTVNGTNGTGSENELTPMVSTHTGGTGARINCRVTHQASGSPAMQVNMNYTMGTNSYLKVKVWKMTFLNRS